MLCVLELTSDVHTDQDQTRSPAALHRQQQQEIVDYRRLNYEQFKSALGQALIDGVEEMGDAGGDYLLVGSAGSGGGGGGGGGRGRSCLLYTSPSPRDRG